MPDSRFMLLSINDSNLRRYGIEAGSLVLVDREQEAEDNQLIVTKKDGALSVVTTSDGGARVGVILGRVVITQIII